jgi:hypothetical protein
VRILTRQTEANAGYRRTPRCRNLVFALRTMRQSRAVRQSTFRTVDTVFDRCIDLILNRTLGRPTSSHSQVSCK